MTSLCDNFGNRRGKCTLLAGDVAGVEPLADRSKLAAQIVGQAFVPRLEAWALRLHAGKNIIEQRRPRRPSWITMRGRALFCVNV
jgi:hypothetical protein